MTATARLYTILGASILRSSSNFPQVSPVRFCKLFPLPSVSLRFHRYSSYAVTLESEATIIPVNSRETEFSVNSNHRHHPWPEWVNFVDCLKTKGYLTESAAVSPPPSAVVTEESGGMEKAAYTEMSLLKDACLKFARDRFDIFKSLSSEDIQAVVDKGCPNLYRKAVNSAKRLRAHLKLDEGDVCSVCNLRGSCDRAYILVNDSEAARTVDIIRILLLYALDPLVISGGEKPPGRETIDISARKLLRKVIELSETPIDPELPKPVVTTSQKKKQSPVSVVDEKSRNVEMKRGDWMCTKCNFKNFARNERCFKCGESEAKSVHRDDVEIKKGDWICSDCNFVNFSRNIRCLKCKTEGPKRVSVDEAEMKKGDWGCTQCDFVNFASNRKCLRCQRPRPKRQLNPGEWECPKCDFLNYRRNIVCKKCNHDRPVDSEVRYEDHVWKKPF